MPRASATAYGRSTTLRGGPKDGLVCVSAKPLPVATHACEQPDAWQVFALHPSSQ